MGQGSINSSPVIGTEEEVWVAPIGTIFGAYMIECPAGVEGLFKVQPRVWWEPIEDEE